MGLLKRPLAVIGCALVLSACGTTLAPQELLDARTAYDHAEHGPAAQLTPAQLDTAKQALDKAEQSFRSDGDADTTKNLAYIAMRKSQIADAQGQIAQAEQERAKAERDLQAEQSAEAAHTREKLSQTQAELANVQRQSVAERQAAARRAAEQEKKIEEQEQEVKKTEAQLAQEKKEREAVEKKLSSAMASLSQIAKVKEEKRGVVITMSGSVLFASGKYDLLPIAQSRLDGVAKALQDQGFKQIVVEGYTDSRGSAARNETLSFERADAVRSYLVSRGIPADKIRAVGFGKEHPIATNSTAEGRAENRRVELVVTPE
jgi:outer membrane protein OmpA-like peptidoglycan-associated protein